MEYKDKIKDKEKSEERYTLAEWRLIDTMRRGKSIEIPSLNLKLNPNGSVTHLDDKVNQ